MKKISKVLSRIISNLSYMLHKSFKDDFSQIKYHFDDIENITNNLTQIISNQHFILSVLSYYGQHPDEGLAYKEELAYIYKHRSFVNFPYEYSHSPESVSAQIDIKTGLPFVLHKGKKLFFPNSYGINRSKEVYAYLENNERITQRHDDKKSPHQYQSTQYHIEEGDVLLDIGCAEGLFSLDNIEKASHIYLIECDKQWISCLANTFAPFTNKVTIINKKIGLDDTDDTITLNTLLSKTEPSPIYLKMDIEGAEVPVLEHAQSALSNYPSHIKIGVAAYHKQNDCKQLTELFSQLSFNYELSSGYMLFNSYDIPEAPYFRKGIIRASNNY